MGDFNAKLEINTREVNQPQSRNGKHMKKMMDDTDTIPTTLKAHQGMWTRTRKRLDKIERSVIDYIIMTKTITEKVIMIHVDEAGLYRLKGKEETDHNSIIVQLELPTATRTTQEKITNYKDKDGWVTFNRIVEDKLSNKIPEGYD